MSYTENGAPSFSTTGSAVLNFFFKTVRNTPDDNLSELLSAAWNENPSLTLKAIFHLRDCRGGKGERKQFRNCISWLISSGNAKHVRNNLSNIPFFGTFKDLLVATADTVCESDALKVFATTLADDIDNVNANANTGTFAPTTLAGKWAPTEGGSLDKKYKFTRKLVNLLRGTCAPSTINVRNLADYRKMCSKLRTHIDVVEKRMCAGDWTGINFERVPSVALKNYRVCFAKHTDKYAAYLARVKEGTAKINAKVFPHDLVSHYISGGGYDETIELQWKKIVADARKLNLTGFPLVDVSSSMNGQPMIVAIALGLLLCECTAATSVGQVMTFETSPNIVNLDLTETLQQKVHKIKSMSWGGSTNIEAAFTRLLDNAIAGNQMPKTLYIFSDMQFDQATNNCTNLSMIESKYKDAGFTRPNIVFWNLRGNTVDFPATEHISKCACVSGFSQALLELFIRGDVLSPYAIMLSALTVPRYDCVIYTDGDGGVADDPNNATNEPVTVQKDDSVDSESSRSDWDD